MGLDHEVVVAIDIEVDKVAHPGAREGRGAHEHLAPIEGAVGVPGNGRAVADQQVDGPCVTTRARSPVHVLVVH